jgi:predicted transcriptional regulator
MTPGERQIEPKTAHVERRTRPSQVAVASGLRWCVARARKRACSSREVITHEVVLIHPDAMLQEAAHQRRAAHISVLPVCDGEHLIGLLTDHDITIRATAEGHDPKATKVREVMTCEDAFFLNANRPQAFRGAFCSGVRGKDPNHRLPIAPP